MNRNNYKGDEARVDNSKGEIDNFLLENDALYVVTDGLKTNPSANIDFDVITDGSKANFNVDTIAISLANNDSKTNNSINAKLGPGSLPNTIEEDAKVKNRNGNGTIGAIKETSKTVFLSAFFKSGNTKAKVYSNAPVRNAFYDARARDGRDGFKIDGNKIDSNGSVSNIETDIKVLTSYITGDVRNDVRARDGRDDFKIDGSKIDSNALISNIKMDKSSSSTAL